MYAGREWRMKITILVKPNARKESVEQIDERNFIVKVHAPPQEDKANERLLKLLAEYLNLSPSCLSILKGHASKHKTIEVTGH